MGGSRLVAWFENMYYGHDAPPAGGTPAGAMNGSPTVDPRSVDPQAPVAALSPLGRPANVRAIAQPLLPFEGQWEPIGRTVRGAAAMYAATGGYPYFVQAYGKVAWDVAPRTPITAADVAVAAPEAEAELGVGFFGSRYERATPAEREYLRAMADVAVPDGAPGGRWSTARRRWSSTRTARPRWRRGAGT